MKKQRLQNTKRSGTTLLEVLLSAVILAGALAALSQLATNGINASLRTEMDTIAAVKCQSKLNELLAMPADAQLGITQPFADSAAWNWTAELQDGPSKTLSVLSVTVNHSGNSQTSTSFQLSRLVSTDHFQSTDTFGLVSER